MKPEKIAPGLMAALEDYDSERYSGLSRHMRSLGLIYAEAVPKEPRTVVFLHCDEKARLDHLRDYGARINQDKGRVRTAILPLAWKCLDKLSEDPLVDRIIPSRYLRLLMDVAPSKVGLPAFWSSSRLKGKGVIVGVVDSGIDPNHPAFQGRILRIWDQTLPGPGVQEGGYGVELTGSLLTVSRDYVGHGSHVAGIAAGDHVTFGGVAPEAELVVVKSDLMDAHVADGIRYIFRVAGDLQRPAVVNLSLGGHGDAHDGTDSLSQIIYAESGPGRIVCCATGNEGNDNIHAQTKLSQGGTRTIRFRVPVSSGQDAIFIAALNGWYPGKDRIEVAVRSPGGFQTPYQGVITTGSYTKTFGLPDGRIRISTPGPDPANGDHNFLIEIRHAVSSSLPVTAGVWQLRLRGKQVSNGQVDVWTLDTSQRIDVIFSGKSVQDTMKVGSPGAAASAVTVGSYTTKVQWTDIDGLLQQVGLDLDDISDFSSEGPLRDGKQKPDVAAPGAMIGAALSADSPVSRTYVISHQYRIMAGTSMATPFVTGIVALLLQRDRTLDHIRVKALLRNNSRIPGKPSGAFDPKWGFGLINVSNL